MTLAVTHRLRAYPQKVPLSLWERVGVRASNRRNRLSKPAAIRATLSTELSTNLLRKIKNREEGTHGDKIARERLSRVVAFVFLLSFVL